MLQLSFSECSRTACPNPHYRFPSGRQALTKVAFAGLHDIANHYLAVLSRGACALTIIGVNPALSNVTTSCVCHMLLTFPVSSERCCFHNCLSVPAKKRAIPRRRQAAVATLYRVGSHNVKRASTRTNPQNDNMQILDNVEKIREGSFSLCKEDVLLQCSFHK